MEDSRTVPPFRCNQIETGKLAKEWGSWKESLGCYFAAYGITDQQVMKAKPLQLGGPALQTVFKNLKDRDHMPVVSLMLNGTMPRSTNWVNSLSPGIKQHQNVASSASSNRSLERDLPIL